MLNIKMDKGDKVHIGIMGGIKDVAAEIGLTIKLIRDQIKEGSGKEVLESFDNYLAKGLILAFGFEDDDDKEEEAEKKKQEEPSKDKDKAELMKEIEKMMKEIFK